MSKAEAGEGVGTRGMSGSVPAKGTAYGVQERKHV